MKKKGVFKNRICFEIWRELSVIHLAPDNPVSLVDRSVDSSVILA